MIMINFGPWKAIRNDNRSQFYPNPNPQLPSVPSTGWMLLVKYRHICPFKDLQWYDFAAVFWNKQLLLLWELKKQSNSTSFNPMIWLYDIDMNNIYNISSIATTFGALSKMTFLGQKCIPILGIRHKRPFEVIIDNW